MKKIGGVNYVHYTNINELSLKERELINKAEQLLLSIDKVAFEKYEVLKVDLKNNSITFIECDDWNTASEPTVGDAHKIIIGIPEKNKKEIHRVNTLAGDIIEGTYHLTKKKSNPQIYHNKWMFVSEDYTDFDIEESKAWSKKWQSVIPKGHASKYGYRNYWESLLKEYGLR